MKIAIRRLKDGKPKYVVAKHYNVYRGTISCLWQRYLQTGTSNELVVHAVQLRDRIGIIVFSIYAIGQLWHNRLLQAYLVFAEYSNKQCLIPCEKLDCKPDNFILVPFWWYSIGVHGSSCATQLGTGLLGTGEEYGLVMKADDASAPWWPYTCL